MDRPEPVWRRYRAEAPPPPKRAHWSRRMPVQRIASGLNLRILLDEPAVVHWSADDWASVKETPTRHSGFDLHLAELATRELPAGRRVRFTFRAKETDLWEGRDYMLTIG